MKYLIICVLCFSLFGSCASIMDPVFVAMHLSDKEKSKAVADAGVTQYQTKVVQAGDIAASKEIEEYFKVALRLDPSNANAKRYLDVLQNLRETKLSENIRTAKTYFAKTTRKEDENYAMIVAIQRAATIDAADKEVIKLLSDTKSIRSSLVTAYLGRAETALKGINGKSSEADKERIYIEAFQNIRRAVDVEPNNPEAKKALGNVISNVSAIVESRIEKLETFYAKAQFTEARTRIIQLKDLDAKLGGSFKTKLRDAEYSLNFRWAKYIAGRKEWDAAEARVDIALGIKRTSEAQALKANIIADRDKNDQGASFEAALQNVDAMIATNDLAGAQRLIISLSKKVKDDTQRSALDNRRERLRAQIPALYETGLQAYRAEDFKQAIDVLQKVVAIDAAYEQASDYLEKARAKQALLDTY